MISLPIDARLAEIRALLESEQNLVIEAAPGAGKTTRVPPALIDPPIAGISGSAGGAGSDRNKEIVILEPRRLAARLAARRVAEERGEPLGATVGYQIRFEEMAGPETRLRYVTEGVLTRRLLRDPELRGVGAVILDEFHERHLQADLALSLVRRLQKERRPDLRIIVMSATLDTAPVRSFLGDAPLVSVEGRLYDVAIEHLARPDDRPLEEQVARAVERLISEGLDGDVLVFLPGAAEIRRAMAACEKIGEREGLLILPLHGELSAAEQDRAVRPARRRKVILSTNVAESSVTIDGVVAVIDSGLARVAGHSPWSGLPNLNVARISQAAARQRAGRAGRTGPGRCLRLYTASDFHARPAFDTPEIARSDLSEPALELHAAGIADARLFEWYEAPPEAALSAAETLLARLGAIGAKGEITALGRRMLAFPLHPRLSRLLVECEVRGVAEEGAIVAAMLGERDIAARELFTAEGGRGAAARSGPSDLLDRLDRFLEAENQSPDWQRRRGLDPAAVRQVGRVRAQLGRIARNRARVAGEEERDESLLISILTGYPDRVGRRREAAGKGDDRIEVLLAGGGQAVLSPESVVRKAEFMVAVDADERRLVETGRRRSAAGVVIRRASAIKADWLLDLYLDDVRETQELKWNPVSQRVEAVRRLLYDQLVIDEQRLGRPEGREGEQASRILYEAAIEAGIDGFISRSEVERFLARLEFVAGMDRERSWPQIGEREVLEVFAAICEGLLSFAELRDACARGGFIRRLQERLTAEERRVMERDAPERVAIRGRRAVEVQYERGKSPWIASRLQDFFGMREGPRIAGGRVALVLHLLAPNQRPVQVTSDLAGFWERHYAQVRRELSRRYPRHAWPEDPLSPDEPR